MGRGGTEVLSSGLPLRYGQGMTNKLAIALALIIGGIIAADMLVFGWELHVFLGRRLIELTEYLAFWR